jgi:cytochrome c oxidase assembly factor CtaG
MRSSGGRASLAGRPGLSASLFIEGAVDEGRERRHRLGGLGPVAYMLSTKLAVGLLGIVLTFSPEALYDFYVDQPRHWGLSPLTDQSLGGALMALEQSLVMGTALVVLFIRQLGEAEREQQRAERYGAA